MMCLSSLKILLHTVRFSKMSGNMSVIYIVTCMQCPPCKVFTPRLVSAYQTLQTAGHNFEVVYVGSDRSVEYFSEYFSTMPWLAVPFGDARIDKLTKHFNVKGTYL